MRRRPGWARILLAGIVMLALATLASRYLGPLGNASGFVIPSRAEARLCLLYTSDAADE